MTFKFLRPQPLSANGLPKKEASKSLAQMSAGTLIALVLFSAMMAFSGFTSHAAAPTQSGSEQKPAAAETAASAIPAAKSNNKKPEKKPEKTTQKTEEKKMSTGNPHVLIETNLGNIEVELFADKAPLSTENFLKYVDDQFYNGTIFHRVIGNFMIQGGGFTEGMEQKPTRAPIKNEANNGLSNARGTLAMARTMIVDSATAQFYINVENNTALNHRDPSPMGYGYAVFGKVVNGMDVVDKIKAVPTQSKGGHQDVPSTPVVIKSAKRLN